MKTLSPIARYVSALIFVDLLVSPGVQANEIPNLPIGIAGPMSPFDHDPGWRFGIGLGLEQESEYHGSAESAAEISPYVEVAYQAANWQFQSNLLNNRFIYQANRAIFLSTWLNIEEGREVSAASDNSLDGMGDIEQALELGGGVSWQPAKSLTISAFVQGYSGGDPDKGLVSFVTAHYRLLDSAHLKLDLAADISLADAKHLQAEFGVTDQQAASSAYSAFAIDGGMKSYGVGFSGVYQFSPQLSMAFGMDYEIYASNVADSPIIKAGSDTEVEASVTLIYQF